MIDEYGDTRGIVTLQDVLEAVTGEFTPRNADDAWAVRREDGSGCWTIPIPEMKFLELKPPRRRQRPLPPLSGMMMLLLGPRAQHRRPYRLGRLAL